MGELNIIYTLADVTDNEAVTDLREQEFNCRKYLDEMGIVDNIVVLNEAHFDYERPVLDSLLRLMEKGLVNSVTIKSIHLKLNLEEIKDLLSVAIENLVNVYVFDLNLASVLSTLITETKES